MTRKSKIKTKKQYTDRQVHTAKLRDEENRREQKIERIVNWVFADYPKRSPSLFKRFYEWGSIETPDEQGFRNRHVWRKENGNNKRCRPVRKKPSNLYQSNDKQNSTN